MSSGAEQTHFLAAIAVLAGEPAPDTPVPEGACPLCREPMTTLDALAFITRDGALVQVHDHCANEVNGRRVSAMATFETVADLPDCRACGRPYEMHDRPVTTIWAAMCVAPDGHGIARLENGRTQYYRPAQPVVSRNWPHEVFEDSPVYAMSDEQFARFEEPNVRTAEDIAAFEQEYAAGAMEGIRGAA
jgi:hypothetical protein